MESVDECDFKILQECLTSSEISQITVSVCKKLESHFGNKLDEIITSKAIFEINRKNLDQKINQLTEDLQTQEESLKKYQQNYDSSQKFANEIQNQLTESRNAICRLQDSIQRLEKENLELRRQKDNSNEENYSLHLQIQQKNSELDRLKTEITSLTSQLESAIIAKCRALAIAEEVKSQEISLDFREKRVEQERILFSQQITSLEEELTKKTNLLHNTRSESSARVLIFQTKLNQCEEELKITTESLAQLRECYSSLQRRSEELTKKLDDQRNHELAMHASYREEVSAQTRLADLYKGMMEEAESKANDYSNAVKELQNLLEHATEKYGILESKFNQNIVDHNQEILNKQEMIDELSKELNDANDLIQNIKQERLDQTVEQLAPTAAVASKILKKGLSLTQIYTKLVEVTNELHLEKEENEKLKSQMEIILRELEEKAPILQQQRKDYETAVLNISTLTLRIDELLAENNCLQENTNEAKRLANHNAKENQRLKSEIADLARQVCYLLKEVQESRTGISISAKEVTMETDTLPSSQIISKKLVTFKDIKELQENNQKLLAIVRTLSSRQEEIEKTTDQVNSGELKKKLDRYIAELSDMQISQDRQAKMLESLIKQRDMYKNMCQQQSKLTMAIKDQEGSECSNSSEKVAKIKEINLKKVEESDKIANEWRQWQMKYQEAEDKLKQVSHDFEIYKKDKIAHEQMLNDEIERLRIATEKCSANCCRFKAQLDSANERFSLLQENVITYKNQIKVLEEKCSNYSTTIGKHEQSLMILKDEALDAQSNLSKAEVQLENLRHERQLLRDSEGRLLKEREVLKRERHTHALLKADVEVIKASLERVQAESQLRTEQRLDEATRECAALRRRLQEEQDRFREVSANLERQIIMTKEQFNEEKNLTERIQSELDAFRLKEQDYLKKIEELNSQLQLSMAVEKPITGDDNLSKRLKELEFDLANSQAEVKSLCDQLKAARFQGQQYCDIAESAETQLRESLNQYNNKTKEFEDTINSNQKELLLLKEKNKELEDKLSKTSNNKIESNLKLEEKLSKAEVELEEFIQMKSELEQLKIELQNACTAVATTEEKYAKEMVLHSSDLQVLTKLKEENQVVMNKISKLTQQKDSAEETLIVEKSFWQEQEKSFKNEINELQSRVEDLNTQNEILHNQIQELSEKAVIFSSKSKDTIEQSDGRESFEALNRSLNDENTGSVEQLLSIIKYLRREKDLTIAKLDVLKSENIRLKSQIDLSNKRFEEMKISLDHERENNEIEVLTVTKHSELLRKVETLNAITDSNRVLREERDSLLDKVKDISCKLNSLTDEVVPLREKTCDLETKIEILHQENNSLKNEAMRWRQRANALVERANKASPEDWRRLQTERENLSKLLTSERETYAKCNDELNVLRNEKSRLEEHLSQVENQLQTKTAQVIQMTEDSKRLNQDLDNYIKELNEKVKELTNLRKDLAAKDVLLSDLKNKEIQIRKIAKKYKTQYEELSKTMEENKIAAENIQSIQTHRNKPMNEEDQAAFDREGGLTIKLDELNKQMIVMQSESENLKKEIEIINKTSLEKEERAKLVLKNARTKIMQLTEYKKLCEKEVLDLKEKLDASTNDGESIKNEYEARLAALKSQMEGRISRLEHERSDLQTEKEALLQRNVQLQRQIAGQNNNNAGPSEPPTANIKPMSARTETPLASIRPMSVVVQSRTAAVLPTTAGAPLLLVAQQQVVHTTETSSPTSSHTDYQPASTSRQLLVQSQLSESAESTQREESEILESMNTQQQQQQCQQQTIALVSPRVEQQQQQSQQPTLSSDQQQTAPSSSTQSVSTSHTLIGNKRTRTLESSSTALTSNENVDGTRQEQSTSPKCKRSRQQDLASSTPASVSDIEYQVPTSSQRDQDEEGDDACVVVDCDEGETHNTQEEEFDNDPYEEIEEELRYSVEVEGDNNEVEIVIEEDSSNVEVVRQAQLGPSSDHQQQSEAISSAGTSGDTPFSTRSSRGIVPISRQQPQQHLLLPQQAYEDVGDDCIVPSTPTLFIPRRNDGFGEAISSPQVPQNRFTFGETSIPISSTLTQAHTNPLVSSGRTVYNSTTSGLAQVVQEGMDGTRIDLTQMDDISAEQSIPTTPQQISPAVEHSIPVSCGSLHKQDDVIQVSNEPLINACQTLDETASTILESIEEQEREPAVIDNSIAGSASEENSTISTEKLEEVVVSMDGEDDVADLDTETIEEAAEESINEDNTKEGTREAEASPSSNTRQRTAASAAGMISSVRGATARRSTRTTFRTSRGTRLTPIVWDNQSSQRGQGAVRNNAARGSTSENLRVRGARGRRIRSKYPYNY